MKLSTARGTRWRHPPTPAQQTTTLSLTLRWLLRAVHTFRLVHVMLFVSAMAFLGALLFVDYRHVASRLCSICHLDLLPDIDASCIRRVHPHHLPDLPTARQRQDSVRDSERHDSVSGEALARGAQLLDQLVCVHDVGVRSSSSRPHTTSRYLAFWYDFERVLTPMRAYTRLSRLNHTRECWRRAGFLLASSSLSRTRSSWWTVSWRWRSLRHRSQSSASRRISSQRLSRWWSRRQAKRRSSVVCCARRRIPHVMYIGVSDQQ